MRQKSLTGQKSEFAFCALKAGGGGSCWAHFSNAPLLLFYQQSLSGSAVVVLRQQGRAVCLPCDMPSPWPSKHSHFALCTGTPSYSCGISFQRHFSPPARNCLFFLCQPPDFPHPASVFAVGSWGRLWAPFASPWYSGSSTALAVTLCDRL